AGWAKFLFWEVGVEYDFLRQQFSVIGPDTIQQINNNIDHIISDTNPPVLKSYTFTPPQPASPAADQTLSTAATGLFQFPINPDASNKLYVTVDGNTQVVWDPTTPADKDKLTD